MRFAIVTEGPGDFLVLRAVITSVIPEAEVVPIHPDVPLGAYPEYAEVRGAGLGSGWRGVRAWCQEYGEDLDLLMRAVVDERYDALVIHVDASMADKAGVEHPCPPSSATTVGLRGIILADWLKLERAPGYLLLATPSKSTDAWIVAALGPPLPADLECDKGVEGVLVRKRLLRRRDGEVKKPRKKYESLAHRVASRFDHVRGACAEAQRFFLELERVAALTGHGGGR